MHGQGGHSPDEEGNYIFQVSYFVSDVCKFGPGLEGFPGDQSSEVVYRLVEFVEGEVVHV